MISIIISTYQSKYFDVLSQNIGLTIGNTAYEIIQVKNQGIMSLSKAYNKGAKEAKYDFLLFVHEDVEFLIKDWGEIILKYSKIENAGIFGLAGSLKKFKLPTGFETGIKKYRRVYVKHRREEEIESQSDERIIKVRTLDGVFLAMSKKRWEMLKFNEEIKGFHFYDIDISLRASKYFQNYIIQEIRLIHFSRGSFDSSWIKAALRFNSMNYDFDIPTREEFNYTRKFWYERLKNENISIKNRIRYILKMGFNKDSVKAALLFLFLGFKKIARNFYNISIKLI